jgi:hypothetical protein
MKYKNYGTIPFTMEEYSLKLEENEEGKKK